MSALEEPGRDSNNVHLHRAKGEQLMFLASSSQEDEKIRTNVLMPPSSKLTAAMGVILTWLEEAPDDKIIGTFLYFGPTNLLTTGTVFTEFVMTSKVLGRMLEHANIPFLFYNGRVGTTQKSKAIRSFQEEPEKKILVGLRHTCSNAIPSLIRDSACVAAIRWSGTELDRGQQGHHRRPVVQQDAGAAGLRSRLAHGSAEEVVSCANLDQGRHR